MSEKKFCPLTKAECRRDCAWALKSCDLTDDGAIEYFNCAMYELGYAATTGVFEDVCQDE